VLVLGVQLTRPSHCGVTPSDPVPPPTTSATTVNTATCSTGPRITTSRPAVQTEKLLV